MYKDLNNQYLPLPYFILTGNKRNCTFQPFVPPPSEDKYLFLMCHYSLKRYHFSNLLNLFKTCHSFGCCFLHEEIVFFQLQELKPPPPPNNGNRISSMHLTKVFFLNAIIWKWLWRNVWFLLFNGHLKKEK